MTTNAPASVVVPPKRPAGISIIVPTFNRADLLRVALSSIQRLSPPEDCAVEVLVVDNNSQDDTPKVCVEGSGRYAVRRVLETKQGLNHARNRGAVAAHHEFLVYLDDDMEVVSTWLVACVSALTHYSVDAVCGPVYPKFQSPSAPWLTRGLIDSVASTYSRRGSERLVLDRTYGHELPGCNFGVWRDRVFEIGGFHPKLDRSGAGMLAGGDTEFGLRLVAAGGRTLYHPDCAIEHLISDAKVSVSGLMRRWHGLGRTERALRHLSGQEVTALELVARARKILSLILRGVARALVGNLGGALEAGAGCWKQVGYLRFSPVGMSRLTPNAERTLRAQYPDFE